MRTFVAVVGTGRFQHAAADLSIPRQAVSKRIAGPGSPAPVVPVDG
ncbi:helix-turn-helix domain-containing protein [Streptosporangium lutulentum]|uniref:DNA-binding transcriptional LysR family regulator n=1 Tax=Streptosporangium lutulentum TaxID=1461250 RepID=A0ABT9QCC0_9ACTN|nr:LysR family transcriptional regulator [Streptosporangium lutulentum]MDP9844011.1 DNA-binding transcriptional LysR family regulator [Streptosporangium lutulentum]